MLFVQAKGRYITDSDITAVETDLAGGRSRAVITGCYEGKFGSLILHGSLLIPQNTYWLNARHTIFL